LPESLGEKLRELREKQGLSREQLYSRTKILVKYIEALEDGRWDLLPGQVYLKPFVKSIAEVLGVNYKELYSLIDKTDYEKKDRTVKPENVKFDYRWLVILLMAMLVALVIILLHPSMSGDKTHSEGVNLSIMSDKNIAKGDGRRHSTRLDIPSDFIFSDSFHTLELIATDTVWLMLTAGDDTLYTGILSPGKKISRESFKPFELAMGKSNCLEIIYNNQKLDNERYLKDRRRIKFSDLVISDVDK